MENTHVGPFLIIKKLGSNRRQRVYHARQTEQDRDVALKFIKFPSDVEWSTAVSRIELEVRELQRLDHPNLVKLHGAGVHEDRIFFASELIVGESLASLLSRRRRLPADLVVEYGRQLADLLNYLHQQELIHSKFTPEKILLGSDQQLKVVDLRINRSRRRRWDSSRRRELDIAAYMAPEQFTEGATHRSDLYSLGVILYEMLVGQLPYPPENLARLQHAKLNSPVPSVAAEVMDCPVWLDSQITQMLQPNPRKRPHSAKAVMLAFDEIKKIGKSKKAAVDQVTSGFNALTAGKDKAEARKLLGKKQKRQDAESSPFYQSVPFMLGSLVAMVAFVTWMVWPPSTEEILSRARILMKSDSNRDWGEARELLKPVMQRSSEFADQAETMYYESRRKTMVEYASRGIDSPLQTDMTRLFGKAYRLQEEGEILQASEIYTHLVDVVSDSGNDRYIHTEAKQRLAAIKEILDSEEAKVPDSESTEFVE